MITSVVLTHNSAATLAKALASISWSDEIIVVDDESTDETLKIAEKYHAQILKRSLHENFAAQRNAGLDAARGEWVLFIDSDEIVSPELADEIRSVVKASSEIKGFFISRTDFMWGRELRHGETKHVRLMRLGKKTADRWQRPVHEVWNITGLVGTLSHPILHSPHPNVAQFLSEINKYSSINAKHLYESKTPVAGWHIIAYPTLKFFVNYIWRLGFLDGTPGIMMAIMMSFHSFLTRAKLWLMNHGSRQEKS